MMNKEASIKNMFLLPFKDLNILPMIGKAMEMEDEKILQINKQQMDKGINANGQSIGRYKNFKYKNRYQPVDLKLTGEFRKKMTLTAGEKKAEIFSQDWKEPILEKRYGKNIFGISTPYKSNVAELIKPLIGKMIREKQFK